MPLVNKTFSDIITFTRASTATYFDSAGVLQSAAIDVPRLDYDPATLAARGLLIEEQRTNSIRNNTMVGAVAGTPGTLPTNWSVFSASGLTTTVVGTGTSNGITYIDLRFSGTSTATFYVLAFDNSAVAASAGQSWTESFWVSTIGGSTSNINSLNFNIRWSSGSTDIPFTSTATFTRLSATAVAPAAITNVIPALFINMVSGAAIDITLRIGLPQLELGAFATSVIPTTTTALTRSADVASVNTLSPWFNATASTLYAEVLIASIPPSGTFPNYASLNDGSLNNTISLSSNSFANHRVSTRVGGSLLWDTNAGGSIVAGTPSKWAIAVSSGSQAACANGGAVATNSGAGLASGINVMRIGASIPGSGQATAWLRRITYYPRRLSNAELQAITT